MPSDPTLHRGQEDKKPCAANDSGDCSLCQINWEPFKRKRGRGGAGSTQCRGLCKTKPCQRVASVGTTFCNQHTPPPTFESIPDDVITGHILAFVSPEDIKIGIENTSKRNRRLARVTLERQRKGNCTDCKKKDTKSHYFKRTLDKSCPEGSERVECGTNPTAECCKIPLGIILDPGRGRKEVPSRN